MKNIIRKSATPLKALVIVMVFLIAIAIISFANVSRADNVDSSQNGRLITIHDRGVEKVISTRAITVGDSLKEAGVSVDSKDLVEPAVTEKLVASNYQVNIYRARPVVIIDGNVRQKVITPYQIAQQICQSAGITLYNEDRTTIDRTDDIADGIGLQLTIKRATPFTFTLYGQTSIVRTQGTTVSEMLAEKGIKLTKDDHMSVSLSTKMTEGLAVRIWREGKQTITVDEAVNFEVEKIENVDLDVSYREIKTVGEKGLRSVTYEVIIQDGKEVGRTAIAILTTKQSKKQVEIVGVKGKYTTPSENESITWSFLTNNGFSRVQAAGIMGNIMQEHGFNTTGDGLAQWTGSRKAELYSMSHPENIYTQLNFLLHELTTNYAGVGSAIKASDSLLEVVGIFQNKFERCGFCSESSRIQFARNILASH